MDLFRRVHNRLAVDFHAFQLPLIKMAVLAVLEEKGIASQKVDIASLAQIHLGKPYELRAQMAQAPERFDCSTFTKWVFGQAGIWLPRRTIQQREMGTHVEPDDLQVGDLVFKTSDRVNWYLDDPADNVGHVGMYIGDQRVIHCARDHGVIEGPLSCFTHPKRYRRARRLIPNLEQTYTLTLPEDSEIEIADDIKWIILSSLPPTAFNSPKPV